MYSLNQRLHDTTVITVVTVPCSGSILPSLSCCMVALFISKPPFIAIIIIIIL